jgi:protein-S-isoprenylcysteine O-methyltransferase Ste14
VKPAVLNETWAGIAFWTTVAVTSLYDFALSAGHRVDREARKDRGQVPLTLAVAGGLFAAVVIAGNVHSLELPGSASWPVVAGLIVAWSGFALRVWAVTTLGRFFTKTLTVSAEQPVIDSGPYAFVRHPSYTGLLATSFGFGLMLGNVLSLAVCFGASTGAFVWRIQVEERMLRRGLGAPYEAYAATRKRLVPGVW